ncbi:MAG: AMP-binding protein, partial [Deltaproteobacteria bacterium]|nr:AMP-binding protein [Deltaproteobacteria bacterium]
IAQKIESRFKTETPILHRILFSDKILHWLGNTPHRLSFIKKKIFKKVHKTLGGKIRYIASGGAAPTLRTFQILQMFGIPCINGYGLTETSSIIALSDCVPENQCLGSAGKIVPGTSVKIDQPDTNGVGEICVKGPQVMKGYFLNDQATADVIDSEGWFHTGDTGIIDSAGYLFIKGRKKDLIVTANGKKIFPEEIESHFLKLPFLQEVCVLGLSNNSQVTYDERIHGELLISDATLLSSKEETEKIKNIIEEKNRELPEYKRLHTFFIRTQPFPKTSTLKTKKFELKQEILFRKNEEEKINFTQEKLQTEIGQQVLQILQSFISEGPFFDQTSIQSLGMDSLKTIEFWTTVEEKLGKSISDADKFSFKNLGEIVEALRQNDSTTLTENHYNTGQDPWENLLKNESDDIRQRVENILNSSPRSRFLFLNFFKNLFKPLSHLKPVGLDHLPQSGPFILAPNHESYLDNIFVSCLLPEWIQKNMAVIGAKEFFDQSFTRLIAKLCHTIPVERSQVSSSVLQMGAEVLKEGKILLVHPEGTRSANGELLPLKTGVGILAAHQNCPIVPVYIEGAHEFWPKDAKTPQSRSHITVTFGEAIYPHKVDHPEDCGKIIEEAQEITERLRLSLMALRDGKSNAPFIHAAAKEILSSIQILKDRSRQTSVLQSSQ